MIHRQLKRGEDMNNKENLQYFEATSMKGLFNNMKDWQVKNEKRLLSTNIQQEGDVFTCIALTNPSEVVLCDQYGDYIETEDLHPDWHGRTPVLAVTNKKIPD